MSFRKIGNKPPKKYPLKTLAECWDYFRREAIPAQADVASVHRAQMCFYAGAAFFFDQTMAIGEPDVPEDAGVEHMVDLERELRAYRQQLAATVARSFPVRGNA